MSQIINPKNNLLMKNLFRFSAVACVATMAVLFSSCSPKSDYRDMLPADAFVTVAFNPSSLAEKSGIDSLQNTPLVLQINEKLQQDVSLTAEQRDYIKTVTSDLAETGIDLKQEGYLFMQMDSVEMNHERVGLLFPLADKAKFDKLMTNCKAKVSADGDLTIYDLNEDEVTLVANDKAVVFYGVLGGDMDVLTYAKGLFTQKHEQSLMADKAIADKFAQKNDVAMWMSYKGMGATLKNNPMVSSVPMLSDMMKISMFAALNFEAGKVVLDSNMIYPDKATQDKFESYYAYIKELSSKTYDFMPAAAMGVAAAGIDGAKLFDFLSTMPGYGSMLSANPMVKQVMNAIDGDFALDFAGMLPGNQMPVASLFIQVNDPNIVDTMMGQFGSMLAVKKVADHTWQGDVMGAMLTFGVKDNLFYATTDAATLAAIQGTKGESVANAMDFAKGSSGAMYIDGRKTYDLLSAIYADDMQLPSTQAAMSMLAMFDNLQIWGNMQGGHFVLNMVDKQQNALKTICDTTGKMIEQIQKQNELETSDFVEPAIVE